MVRRQGGTTRIILWCTASFTGVSMAAPMKKMITANTYFLGMTTTWRINFLDGDMDAGMMLSSRYKFLPISSPFYSGWIRMHAIRQWAIPPRGWESAMGPAGRKLLQENVKVVTWAAGPLPRDLKAGPLRRSLSGHARESISLFAWRQCFSCYLNQSEQNTNACAKWHPTIDLVSGSTNQHRNRSFVY
jgi:hypothetical protein